MRARTAELTERLQTAREDERHRLARNLHDDLGSLLTSAKLDAARIKPCIATKAPEALELLADLVATLNSSVAPGRRIIEDLRPSALDNLGWQPNTELMAYRLVQEAFTNITKYAKAHQVWLSVQMHAQVLEVCVLDDGVGFSADAQPGSHYGLLGMRYQVQAEGGRLEITSSPGQGTRVVARLSIANGVMSPA